MTIKQNGGIFGRNPTFNDVTIEGDLNTSGAFNPSGDVTLGGDFFMSSATPDIKITDTNLAHGMTTLTETNTLLTQTPETASNGGVRWSAYSAADIAMQFMGVSTTPSTDGNGAVFRFRASKKSGTTETTLADGEDIATFGNAGSEVVTIKGNGNIALANGAGIDFSATSGTGTSELFDDYEEGTWTPTLTTDGTDFDSVSYNAITAGRYTKVGNLVHIQCRLLTSAVTVGSASGYVQIGGLPFTSVSNSAGTDDGSSAISIAGVSGFAGEQPSAGNVAANSTKCYLLYRTAADGPPALTVVSDVGSGNNIYFSATYISA